MTYLPRFKSRFSIDQVLMTTPAPHCPAVSGLTMADRIAFVRRVEAMSAAGAGE